jgi:hypothetical protein
LGDAGAKVPPWEFRREKTGFGATRILSSMLTHEQKAILHHLGYEWWMFRAGLELLQRVPGAHDPVRNVLIESIAVHGRALIYFFFHPATKPTDWNATHLGLTTATEPGVLTKWRVEREQADHSSDQRTAASLGIMEYRGRAWSLEEQGG